MRLVKPLVPCINKIFCVVHKTKLCYYEKNNSRINTVGDKGVPDHIRDSFFL